MFVDRQCYFKLSDIINVNYSLAGNRRDFDLQIYIKSKKQQLFFKKN